MVGRATSPGVAGARAVRDSFSWTVDHGKPNASGPLCPLHLFSPIDCLHVQVIMFVQLGRLDGVLDLYTVGAPSRQGRRSFGSFHAPVTLKSASSSASA